MKEMTSIFFQALAEPDFHDFRNEVKEVFSIAIAEHFGLSRDGNFFEDDDIDGMLRDPKSAVYAIYVDGRRAGGVALHIDPESFRNRMDLFYFYPGSISRQTNTYAMLGAICISHFFATNNTRFAAICFYAFSLLLIMFRGLEVFLT